MSQRLSLDPHSFPIHTQHSNSCHVLVISFAMHSSSYYNCKHIQCNLTTQLSMFKAGRKSSTRSPNVTPCATILKVSPYLKVPRALGIGVLKRQFRGTKGARSESDVVGLPRCTDDVKIALFKEYYQSFYTKCSLWAIYTQRALQIYIAGSIYYWQLARFYTASGTFPLFLGCKVRRLEVIMRKRKNLASCMSLQSEYGIVFVSTGLEYN